MLRRVILVLSLLFLFAVGQQGVAAHEISHFSEQNTSQQNDKSHQATFCEQCAAYALLGGVVSSASLPGHVVALQYHCAPVIDQQAVVVFPVFRSARAPPFLA